MPTQKYRVETDKGTYEIEVEVPESTTKPLKGTTQAEMIGNTMLEGAKGFASGVLPGAYKAIVSAVPSLVSAAIGTVKGTVNLVKDPEGTLTEAYNAMKGSPGKGLETIQQALELARQDPQAFGRAVGEITGGTEAGILGSKAVPLAPKPIARVVGNTMEQVGTKGKWPIRMMGAHQLGSGNPMGVATMMLPEALERSGGAIRSFGGEKIRPDVATKLQDKFSDAMAKRNVTAFDERAKDAAATARKATLDKAKAERVAGEPTVSETVSEGGTTMRTPYRKPGEDPETLQLKKQGYSPEMIERIKKADPGDPMKGAPIRIAPGTGSYIPEGMGARAEKMGTETVNTMRNAGMDVPEGGFKSTRDIDRMAAGPKPIRIQGSPGLDKLMRETKVPDDLTIEGEEGLNPPGPTIGELNNAPAKMKLAGAETAEVSRLTSQGMSLEDALNLVQQQRDFNDRFGLSTPTAPETRFPKGMRGRAPE